MVRHVEGEATGMAEQNESAYPPPPSAGSVSPYTPPAVQVTAAKSEGAGLAALILGAAAVLTHIATRCSPCCCARS